SKQRGHQHGGRYAGEQRPHAAGHDACGEIRTHRLPYALLKKISCRIINELPAGVAQGAVSSTASNTASGGSAMRSRSAERPLTVPASAGQAITGAAALTLRPHSDFSPRRLTMGSQRFISALMSCCACALLLPTAIRS